MDYNYRRSSGTSSSEVDPPLSRLFIIGPKTLTESDFREHFEEFGNIEEIWMVNDRNTREYKGVTYIKYSKTSEAAEALEKMNGATIGDSTRRLKVMIASSRDQGSRRDGHEEEKMHRLFIICSRSATEEDLQDHFKQFGDLDYVSIVKDRNTRESKGIAFIKYHKFSHTAKAYEQCDRKYKPVFAEPKSSAESMQKRIDPRDFLGGPAPLMGMSGGRNSGFNSVPPLIPPSNLAGPSGVNEGFTKLTVIACPDVNQDQLWKLFDIVPGMDYCQVRYQGGNPLRPARMIGEVVYNSPEWAAHAREKLHGFEYPPGFRMIVKPIMDGPPIRPPVTAAPERNDKKTELMHLAETIAKASSLIQAAGLNPSALLNIGGLSDSSNSTLKCSVPVPDPKPLVDIDEECVARCFIVCTTPLPNTVLKDLFCRFGNLIEAYMLANRNCGYARYADRSSCEEAIKILHGAEVNGIRMKVIKAEEPRKRQRTDDNYN